MLLVFQETAPARSPNYATEEGTGAGRAQSHKAHHVGPSFMAVAVTKYSDQAILGEKSLFELTTPSYSPLFAGSQGGNDPWSGHARLAFCSLPGPTL